MATLKHPPASKAKPAKGGVSTSQRVRALLNELQQLFNEDNQADARRNGNTLNKAPAKVAVDETVLIRTFEDDPFQKAIAGADPVAAEAVTQEVPTSEHELLRTEILGDQPDPLEYDPSTREFRFWNAAAALARGIDFWASVLPEGTRWSTDSGPMRVNLDAGVDLNAFYARSDGLKFFHDEVEGNAVFSGESPDVVCHELGHAILDALKPELFDATSLEVASFHEAFGDMSGMLSALQLESMRKFVLDQTAGDLRLNSRLSQMARELGWAIRQFAPTAVDRDSLRNAANSFFYQDPADLPPEAPASELSSEPHSFSRIFSGAFLDVLAGMFETSPSGNPDDEGDRLAAVTTDAGRLLVEGVRVAPVGSGYYRQVAAGMIQADQSLFNGQYRSALSSAFVRRGILAPESAVALARDLKTHAGQAFGVTTSAARARHLHFEGDNEGYKKTGQDAPALPLRPLATRFGVTFYVHMPAEPHRFGVSAAAITGGAAEGTNSEDDARSFVEDLIQLDRIADDTAGGVLPVELLAPGEDYPSDKTHHLVKSDGRVVLKRRHFDCGCRQWRIGR
jgi:hypothetical protein